MSLDSVWNDMPLSSNSDSTEASGPMFSSQVFLEFSNTIQALEDEVTKACTLILHPTATHTPQLHLLEE